MGVVSDLPAPVRTLPKAPRTVIITGMSGAGRRTCAHAMEDLGWFVVDNLPPSMLPELIGTANDSGLNRLAVGLDVRGREMFDQLPAVFSRLRERGISPEICFLEASDEAIVRRQESSRRPLPLQGDGRLLVGIEKERRMLSDLRASADLVIDTSRLNVHQLAARVAHAYGGDEAGTLRVQVMSFGFKNGVPLDADFVFDVRFLPNPHWVPELRPQTGLSEAVSGYVLAQDGATEFLDDLQSMFRIVAPGYLREGKRHSTAMTEAAAARLRADGMQVSVLHRDLGLE